MGKSPASSDSQQSFVSSPPGDEKAVARLNIFVGSLLGGRHLAREEAAELLGCILDGGATEKQIAAALNAIAQKGETADELIGFAEAMRSRMVPLRTKHSRFIDTAGTGASAAKTFNVSTAAAIVAAAAGVPVAKHGARASTSNSGSADAMTSLGATVPVPIEVSERVFDSLGFCFLFAPAHHPASARVAGIRRRLGIRTCFNLVGPLSNPACSPRQLVGVSDVKYVSVLACALKALGSQGAWVVHGSDGLDEITLAGPTRVTELREGELRAFDVNPEDFGFRTQSLEPAKAADAPASARIIREVLEGKRRDVCHALVVVNAAAALRVGGMTGSLRQCARCADAAIEGGRAAETLSAYLAATRIPVRIEDL